MPWKPWGAEGTVVSWANRPVGVPLCPAPLRPAAPPCAAPPGPARGMSGFWIRQLAYCPMAWFSPSGQHAAIYFSALGIALSIAINSNIFV